MRFFSQHPFLVIIGFVSGLILFLCFDCLFKKSPTIVQKVNVLLETKPSLFLLSFALGIFVLWAYAFSKTYYCPINAGVIADTYRFLHWAMRGERNYYIPHHLVYPWVSGKLIWLFEIVGFLSRKDPLFLEKAFGVSALPTKVFMVLALVCFSRVLWVSAFNRFDSLLAIFFVSSCASCWSWGHESNAIGIGLAMEIIASAVFLIWCRRSRLRNLFVLGFVLAACVYAHITTVYFVMGGVICVLSLVLIHGKLKMEMGRKSESIWVFFAPILLLGGAFYGLAGRYVGGFDPRAIFHVLSSLPMETEGFGSWVKLLPRFAKDNLVAGLMNLFNYWDPKSSFDQGLIFFQISLLSSLGFSLFMSAGWRRRQVIEGITIFFALTSLVTFLGFLSVGEGTHYYAMATVPNAGLFLFLLMQTEPHSVQHLERRILLCLLVCSMVLYSGFSSWNVFRGSNINDAEYYRVSRIISDSLGPTEKAVYVRPFEFGYNDNMIRNYYHAEFGRIAWESPPLGMVDFSPLVSNLKTDLQQGKKLFLSDQVSGILRCFISRVEIQHLARDVNWVQVL